MGTLVPGQNFDHLLDVISGYDGMHDLQHKGAPAEGEEWNRGALISLDAAGNLVAGLDVDHAMPMWAINATGDFDVESDVGNISGGVVAAFPATGGYELVTTEFDETAVASYVPNAPLIEDTGTAGDITAGTVPVSVSESIVGIVSRGVFEEVYGQSVLQFWPVYLPARA
jgi:hypothetical protein